jgi:hypothetical protein
VLATWQQKGDSMKTLGDVLHDLEPVEGCAANVLHIHGYASQNALAAAARGLMFVERYGRVFPT